MVIDPKKHIKKKEAVAIDNSKELSTEVWDRMINGISFVWPSWRPPIFETPEEMQEKIHDYFESDACKRTIVTKDGIPISVPHPTITWLSLWLGFSSRKTFYNYAKKEDFLHTIERAKSFIENEYEKMLVVNPTWAIFALKNFWWKDTQTFEGEMTNNNRSVVVEYKQGKYENLDENWE